ncbi:hypothetical protein C8Q79DRAFT_1003719 [Trametes meyenii]|nr:hypothetical protein C8Q79DRAFT_1003719 [Trametes meyenii]
MAPLREWLGRPKAGRTHAYINQRGDDAEVLADVPPFLLPLDLRVKLRARELRSSPYRKPLPTTSPDKDTSSPTSPKRRTRKRNMPSFLNRLTPSTSYPIVVVQYKNEFRGVGHEAALHWVLMVITDKKALSGPSFQAYAQTTRPRKSRRPRLSDSSAGTSSSSGSRRSTSASVTMGTLGLDTLDGPSPVPIPISASTPSSKPHEMEAETDVQWYTQHAPATLFDVCATVRTLCLGGVQVGSVKAADLEKLVEYLRCHPPVPTARGWCSRDYVLELLELLRPFKLLRADLQHKKAGKKGERVEVRMGDLLPELEEVGRATQESIDLEDYLPVVKYHS